jgi:cobalt transporter subunit CbtB
MHSLSQTQTVAGATLSTRIAAGCAALLLGFALFFLTGFAAPEAIHNATHDTRHALGLPCH